MSNQTEAIQQAVREAIASEGSVHLVGGDSKPFLGNPCTAPDLAVGGHRGIINYEPTELVITARAGTPIAEVDQALAERGQHLPFEPPALGGRATLGGTLACGLSGPARPYAGSARDMVLGIRIIDGRGDLLRFGGEVMKNVAGYDVSRLMVGSHGTLGVIMDASLKVLPQPAKSASLRFEIDQAEAIETLNRWAGTPLPINASAWLDGVLNIRLSGAKSAVEKGCADLGGERFDDPAFWSALNNHQLPFFASRAQDEQLWRLSLPPTTPPIDSDGQQLVEWGGAQRWLISRESAGRIRERVAQTGGHATLYRSDQSPSAAAFQPLNKGLLALHQRIKAAMDPHGVFNPGVMAAEI